MKKILFITVNICFALVLGTSSQIQAQSVAGITGVAGFETGLQVIASVKLAHESKLGDLNPPGAIIHWGDNTNDNQGLLSCSGGESDPCTVYGSHWYAAAGAYTVSIIYSDPAPFLSGPGSQHTLNTTATITPPVNDPGAYVILSIGDSIASGEGNPVILAGVPGQNDYPFEGFWDDPYSNDLSAYPQDERQEWPSQSFPCHRSILAGPAQAAGEIQSTNPGVTFIHYACSGAKINASDTSNTSAQDAVGQLRVARGRLPRIDVLLISAGANSLYGPNSFGNGFGALVNYCLHVKNDCDNNASVSSDLTTTFANLPSEYANLAKEINCINPGDGTPEPSCNDSQTQKLIPEKIPKLVLITEYMDPTHDAQGNYPLAATCPPYFSLVDQAEWQFFHDSVVAPLNQAVDNFPTYSRQAGSTVPTYFVAGIADDFLYSGICAGANRWVNNIQDSEHLLGSAEPPGTNTETPPSGTWTNGTAHPNSARLAAALGQLEGIDPVPPNCSPKCGQEDYRDKIYAAIVSYNPPVTTASATAGGAPYKFGTWTNTDVVVTLSATNAIQESGVMATYYGVDNANCSPGSQNCTTYSGPFTISSTGKHTVGFFSKNKHNALEYAAQPVQVFVDKNPALSSVPDAMTIPQGESASYTITLGHTGWTGQTINLSCTTDAQLTGCTMLPTSVTLDASNSNASVATVVTTLGTFPALGHGVVPLTPGSRPNPLNPLLVLRLLLALATAAFLVAAALALRARRWAPLTHFTAIALLFGLLCAGCNSAAQPPSTPKGLYTVTITGTDGTTTNTVKTTLIVK